VTGRAAAAGWAVAVASVSCGCGAADPPEATAGVATAIESDAGDAEHRFAVGVVTTPPAGSPILCSGVLLAPNLVATARHCVAAIDSVEVDCATSRFGATFDAAAIRVTTDATLDEAAGSFVGVSRVVVTSDPANLDGGPDPVCGDDLALLVLATSIDLPQYATPTIDPPMTDATLYTPRVTAIGYGITSPDAPPSSARVRRIKEDIPLACVPQDPALAGCFASPDAMRSMTVREFLSGDGSTCEGDSGSGAFEQSHFDQGRWVAFGVLSRGAVSPDGHTCVQPIYTRFDAWGPFLVATATSAAADGGYDVPEWALPDAGGSGATNALRAEGGGAFGCTAVQRSGRRGPADSAAFAGGLAMLVAVRRTRHTRRQSRGESVVGNRTSRAERKHGAFGSWRPRTGFAEIILDGVPSATGRRP
jgi:hypothetical protein